MEKKEVIMLPGEKKAIFIKSNGGCQTPCPFLNFCESIGSPVSYYPTLVEWCSYSEEAEDLECYYLQDIIDSKGMSLLSRYTRKWRK